MGIGLATACSALSLNNLTLGYNRHPAVHHLACDIRSGSLIAVVGPNGAGKSTLLKALAGELKPIQGSISLSVARDRIAYLPQQTETETSFPVSVFDMVAMGLWRQLGPFGAFDRASRHSVRLALDRVGLGGLDKRPIGTLSGGQLQRARFARMMLQNADLLLLDEPFNAIDSRTTDDLLDLLHEWHAEGRTIIAVLHDLDRVNRHFPQSILIARELIGFGATEQVLTADNLARARTISESFEAHAPVCHRGTADTAA